MKEDDRFELELSAPSFFWPCITIMVVAMMYFGYSCSDCKGLPQTVDAGVAVNSN